MPVKRAAVEEAAAVRSPCRRVEIMPIGSPTDAVGNRGAAGVEQKKFRIEAMPAPFGAIHAPAIPKGGWQPGDEDMPEIAGSVFAAIKPYFGQDRVITQRLHDKG